MIREVKMDWLYIYSNKLYILNIQEMEIEISLRDQACTVLHELPRDPWTSREWGGARVQLLSKVVVRRESRKERATDTPPEDEGWGQQKEVRTVWRGFRRSCVAGNRRTEPSSRCRGTFLTWGRNPRRSRNRDRKRWSLKPCQGFEAAWILHLLRRWKRIKTLKKILNCSEHG